jgi:hypothetical protein
MSYPPVPPATPPGPPAPPPGLPPVPQTGPAVPGGPRRGAPWWLFIAAVVALPFFGCVAGVGIGSVGSSSGSTETVTAAQTITEAVTETVSAEGSAPGTVTVTETAAAAEPAAPVEPAAPAGPVTTVGNGDFLVGTGPGQVAPGTYTFGVDSGLFELCTVSTESQDGSIIDINNANEGNVIFTVSADAFKLSVSGCTPGTPA